MADDTTDNATAARRRIVLYLLLIVALSLPGYWLMAHPGVLSGRLSAAAFMWAPGVAGLITLRMTGQSLAAIGWRWPRPRYLLAALAIPFVCELPGYVVVWAAGMTTIDLGRWPAALPYGLTAASPTGAAALLLSFGLLDKLSRALGEEIGWRGVLVPQLAQVTTPFKAGLISGAVWAMWHVPVIAFGTYHANGVPVAAQIGFFVVAVIAMGPIFAWLRLASGSVWPAVLAHGFYNLMTQSFFDQASVDRGHATWIIGEFGAGSPLLTVLLVLVGWRAFHLLRPARAVARAAGRPE